MFGAREDIVAAEITGGRPGDYFIPMQSLQRLPSDFPHRRNFVQASRKLALASEPEDNQTNTSSLQRSPKLTQIHNHSNQPTNQHISSIQHSNQPTMFMFSSMNIPELEAIASSCSEDTLALNSSTSSSSSSSDQFDDIQLRDLVDLVSTTLGAKPPGCIDDVLMIGNGVTGWLRVLAAQ